jgi:malonyl CoA-acyl carrier protein transacylase
MEALLLKRLKSLPGQVALVFPGQATQFNRMGLSIYKDYPYTHPYFEEANDLMGFSLTDVMFHQPEDNLRPTNVSQPAIFLNSYLSYLVAKVMYICDIIMNPYEQIRKKDG